MFFFTLALPYTYMDHSHIMVRSRGASFSCSHPSRGGRAGRGRGMGQPDERRIPSCPPMEINADLTARKFTWEECFDIPEFEAHPSRGTPAL